MSDCPMLISNKLHSFRNFLEQFTIYKVQFNYADDSAAKLYFVNGKL